LASSIGQLIASIKHMSPPVILSSDFLRHSHSLTH
jgi:hypothetical protein